MIDGIGSSKEYRIVCFIILIAIPTVHNFSKFVMSHLHFQFFNKCFSSTSQEIAVQVLVTRLVLDMVEGYPMLPNNSHSLFTV